ncbi:MAG: hypothetical protein ACE1ZA_09785 [Pseudomonadales bacterium]
MRNVRQTGQSVYIRFITREQDEASHSLVDVFTHAYRLRDSDQLQPHEEETLGNALRWLQKNVTIPKLLKEPENERAICWFKSAAEKPLANVWKIVHVLREHDVQVEMIKTLNPGAIIYEDGWQIAAKPHKANRIRVAQR